MQLASLGRHWGGRQSFASEIVATASSFGESRQKRTKNWEGFLKRTLMRLEAGRWGWEGEEYVGGAGGAIRAYKAAAVGGFSSG